MLQCVAVSELIAVIFCTAPCDFRNMVQSVAMCSIVLQCVALCCSVLYCVAVHELIAVIVCITPCNLCNMVQCVAVCSNVLQCVAVSEQTAVIFRTAPCNLTRARRQKHVGATKHCNTLQHTASHCSTVQHNAAHHNTLQHTAIHLEFDDGAPGLWT